MGRHVDKLGLPKRLEGQEENVRWVTEWTLENADYDPVEVTKGESNKYQKVIDGELHCAELILVWVKKPKEKVEKVGVLARMKMGLKKTFS